MSVRLLTVAQVCEETGLSPQKVRRLARTGQMVALKSGDNTSPWLFRADAIRLWIANREAVAARRAG